MGQPEWSLDLKVFRTPRDNQDDGPTPPQAYGLQSIEDFCILVLTSEDNINSVLQYSYLIKSKIINKWLCGRHIKYMQVFST